MGLVFRSQFTIYYSPSAIHDSQYTLNFITYYILDIWRTF